MDGASLTRVSFAALLVLFSLLSQVESKASDDADVMLVEKFLLNSIKQITAIVENDALSDDKKTKELLSMFKKRFDVVWMARFALASRWKKLTSEEKKHYVSAYTTYVEKTCVPLFLKYKNEESKILSITHKGRDMYLVKMSVKATKLDKVIDLEYIIRVKHGKRVIIRNMVVEGINLLSSQRAEFSALLTANQDFKQFINVISE